MSFGRIPSVGGLLTVFDKIRAKAGATIRKLLGARTKFYIFAGFGVLVPLLPIAFAYVARLIDKGTPPGLFSVLAGGELAIVATVLAAATAGEVFARKSRGDGATWVFIGAIIVALGGAGLYAEIARAEADGSHNREHASPTILASNTSTPAGAPLHGGDTLTLDPDRAESQGGDNWPAILSIWGFGFAVVAGVSSIAFEAMEGDE